MRLTAMAKNSDKPYSEEEAKQRFDAALRGARLATPQPMADIPKKRAPKARSSVGGKKVKSAPKAPK